MWQEYKEELYKKDLHDPDNHDGVITDPHHKVKVKIAQLCPTVCNPMDYTVHGIFQARILEWVGEGNGNRLQYSFLEGPMDREAW